MFSPHLEAFLSEKKRFSFISIDFIANNNIHNIDNNNNNNNNINNNITIGCILWSHYRFSVFH